MTFLVSNSKKFENYHLQLHSGPILLFFLKADHFRNILFVQNRYNTISRLAHDLPATPRSPSPQD